MLHIETSVHWGVHLEQVLSSELLSAIDVLVFV